MVIILIVMFVIMILCHVIFTMNENKEQKKRTDLANARGEDWLEATARDWCHVPDNRKVTKEEIEITKADLKHSFIIW